MITKKPVEMSRLLSLLRDLEDGVSEAEVVIDIVVTP